MTNNIIRKPEVSKITGLPHSTIYRLIKQGTFPAPIKLGERASGWFLNEVEEWINSRKEHSRNKTSNTRGYNE